VLRESGVGKRAHGRRLGAMPTDGYNWCVVRLSDEVGFGVEGGKVLRF